MGWRASLGLTVAGAALAVACSSGPTVTSAGSGGSAGTSSGGSAGTSSGGSAGVPGAGGASGSGGSGAAAGAGGGFPCTQAQCSIYDTDCAKGICTATGCSTTPRNQGSSCDTGLDCKTNGTCQSGKCVGTPVGCATSNPCQTASCVEGKGCVTSPASGGTCDDGDACTGGDTCVSGQCQGTLIDLAKTAAVTSSGGGTGNQGVGNVHDGTCNAYWVSNTDTSPAWVELDWQNPVSIGSMYIDTDDTSQTLCHVNGTRYIASATLKWWDGSAWQPIVASATPSGDLSVSLSSTITTTKLRLENILSGPTNTNYNTYIFEWWVFPSHNCTPPSG